MESIKNYKKKLAAERLDHQRTMDQLSALKERESQVKKVLRKLALGGTLNDVLGMILKIAEKKSPGTIASILLVDKDGKRLINSVESRLPDYFVNAINGTPVKDEMGSCGTAAFRGETIAINNIQSHPYWRGVKKIIKKTGLNSCWSQPVISSDGVVVGTFALYHAETKNPSSFELELMEDMAQLAAISLESHRIKKEKNMLNKMLSNIINSMPSILVCFDPNGNVTHWNNDAQEETGITSEESVGQPIEKVFPLLAGDGERLREAMKTQKVFSEQRQTMEPDGKKYYKNITIYPLISDGTKGGVVRIDDVTEQVRLQEMMIQNEKILSVGGLAAGMAHEINNPLAGMMQSANVIKSRLESVDMPANIKASEELGLSMEDIRAFMEKREIFRMLDAIHESGLRTAEIVKNMLSFARKSDANISSNFLNQLMDEILDLAATDYDLKKKYDFKSIEIIKEYANDLPLVPCESAKIQQVLLNILRNGAQAMQTSGTKFPKFIIRIYTIDKPEMICIEIEDNGPGMDEETKSKVFDPFFTTKPVGVGTGLGLSVSYFIITENHKGTITVSSEPGRGANFIIRLPIHRKFE
ncbi:MAG: ATP-binding protein [Desulfobacterales bacterium]|nr:ATP-binding protein [Desulfobacterales bacterium]